MQLSRIQHSKVAAVAAAKWDWMLASESFAAPGSCSQAMTLYQPPAGSEYEVDGGLWLRRKDDGRWERDEDEAIARWTEREEQVCEQTLVRSALSATTTVSQFTATISHGRRDGDGDGSGDLQQLGARR